MGPPPDGAGRDPPERAAGASAGAPGISGTLRSLVSAFFKLFSEKFAMEPRSEDLSSSPEAAAAATAAAGGLPGGGGGAAGGLGGPGGAVGGPEAAGEGAVVWDFMVGVGGAGFAAGGAGFATGGAGVGAAPPPFIVATALSNWPPKASASFLFAKLRP